MAMTDVAEYINEMKRLHENAIKVQEILNNIIDLNVRYFRKILVFRNLRVLLCTKGRPNQILNLLTLNKIIAFYYDASPTTSFKVKLIMRKKCYYYYK